MQFLFIYKYCGLDLFIKYLLLIDFNVLSKLQLFFSFKMTNWHIWADLVL